MRSRSLRVRTKVVALLASLVALWAFAAFVTVRDGLNLLSVTTLQDRVGLPTEEVVNELQRERRLSTVYLAGTAGTAHGELVAQRGRTDAAVAAFTEATAAGRWAADVALEQRIDAAIAALATLGETRADIDSRRVDRNEGAAAFTTVIEAAFRIYGSLATLDDPALAKDGRTLITLTRAHEVLAQEDALLSGAIAAGRIDAQEQAEFARLVNVQRFLLAEAAAELPDADRARYTEFAASADYRRLLALEDAVVRANDALATVTDGWAPTRAAVGEQLREIVRGGAAGIAERAAPAALGVFVRLALAGVLGLIAVIASIVISITTARDLVRQLERLRNAARDLAAYRLPRVVERLQHGEKVDVEHEAPRLEFGRGEIGQVGAAFNAVQETAIRVAVEQAELRRSVRDVFLSLARRSQALLHRQLSLLDGMERRATDAEELAELFRVDHLATRMRRNAENLIVLSGATAGRAWRRPVPMVDVLRAALAEVEDYTRVTVTPVGSVALVGRAVGDVIHLLAELIENAVSFSPPQTVVRVGGSQVGNGFAIEIEDRGLGMSPQERAVANEQLRDPPEFRLSSTARLGLFVVGRLAERHGISVRLTESPYGGTTAIVLLPVALIAGDTTDGLDRIDAGQLDGTRQTQFVSAVVSRHRSDEEQARKPAPAPAPRPSSDLALPLFDHPDAAPSDPPADPPVTTDPPVVTDPPVTTDPPVATDPPASRTKEPPILTPSGLPWRRRSTGPADRPGPHALATPGAPTHPDPALAGLAPAPLAGGARPAEDVRDRMASYRSGTLRGRTDAARLADTNHASTAPGSTPEPESAARGPARPAQEPPGTEEEG